MKKLFIIICLMAFAFVGCEKEPLPAPQPVYDVPEPIKITNDDWTKSAYPEYIFENDTLMYYSICEKEVEQPVRRVDGCRGTETTGYLWATVYFPEIGDSVYSKIKVYWNTYQEDSSFRFIIKTLQYAVGEELVMHDFYIYF